MQCFPLQLYYSTFFKFTLLQYILQSFKELARICEISKNTYFTEHLWATSSINKSTVEYLQENFVKMQKCLSG